MAARGAPLAVEELVRQVDSGEIDTVVLAFTDMQGRLQGKRLHGQYFLDVVLEHGTEGCNYLLAVDVDMNTVDGYAISSWERGYGDMEFVARPGHAPAAPPPARPRRWCSATWSGSTTHRWPSRRARSSSQLDRAERDRVSRWPAPSSSSSPSTRRTRTPRTSATAA